MVKPLNDLLHKGLSEREFNERVLDGVFISTIQTFVVRLDSKSEQFFVCYYNSMEEFKLKLFELSVLELSVFELSVLVLVLSSIAIYWFSTNQYFFVVERNYILFLVVIVKSF